VKTCAVKEQLLSAYGATTQRYADAANALSRLTAVHERFQEALTETERLAEEAQRAKAALDAHVKNHGCQGQLA